MPRLSRSNRRNIAILIWILGIALFLALAFWNMESTRKDTENRLINESGRMAGQIASLLSSLKWDLDASKIRSAINAAMDDDNVYAIKIETNNGISLGQRRNYLWEPIPWDDEIAENCIQGMNPIKIKGKTVGSVEIWISPRLGAEEDGLLLSREKYRFLLLALLWTATFFLILLQWGEFRRFRHFSINKDSAPEENDDKKIDTGLANTVEKSAAKEADSESAGDFVVDAEAGRRFQRRNPDSWRVTAGMFKQTFARGPALISRLYAEGEIAGLCHLGRMLEQAAPCVGAEKLARAARAMQAALNDPDCPARALPVEECATALEEVLQALCGSGKWQSGMDCVRS